MFDMSNTSAAQQQIGMTMSYAYRVVLVTTNPDGDRAEVTLKTCPTRPEANCYANYADHLFEQNGYRRDDQFRWRADEGRVFELDVRRVDPVSP